MKIAVIGATGLVGQEILKVLENRQFPVTELYPVASEKSVGQIITFAGKQYSVISMQDAINQKPHIAIFSAGGSTSLQYAPIFAEVGTTVIDNSSAWRMHENCPLIVPEVNAHILTKKDKIIANPNCSTIQMVVALQPLHLQFGVKRIVVSTYQSVTGTGKKALDQLMQERQGIEGEKIYPYRIDLNLLPHIDVFLENDYTKEEMKMVHETQKIMGSKDIKVTATTVRVPVIGGHSEAINVEFHKDFDINNVREILSKAKGIIVKDDVKNLQYPMPIDAHEKDEVFVGRIRRDESQANTLNMWVVADNLRKGASTNAIQIAEYLLENKIIEL
jgi:aspartate-semialdehyde dehydrogenase